MVEAEDRPASATDMLALHAYAEWQCVSSLSLSVLATYAYVRVRACFLIKPGSETWKRIANRKHRKGAASKIVEEQTSMERRPLA